METIKAGVIGKGFIGPAYVEALRRLGDVEVVAIAGSDEAESKKKAGAWESKIPNQLWIGKRDGNNELMLKDPSLVYPQVHSLIDYIRPIYEFKKRILHVHLKDARVDWDRLNQVGIMATRLEFHTPKLPGLGDVNWHKFFSALTDIQYQGPVVVEVEDRAFEGDLESCKAALVQSRNYIRQFS